MARLIIAGLCVALLLGGAARAAAEGQSLRVMSFNIWVGGEGSGKDQIEGLVEAIRQSKADVVGLQETRGREPKPAPGAGAGGPDAPKGRDAAKLLAEKLGWNYFDEGDDLRKGSAIGVISRHKIIGGIVSAGGKRVGAKVELPTGKVIYCFNVHLEYAPYEPYGLLGIKYEKTVKLASEAEAVRSARQSRGKQIAEALETIRPLLAAGEAVFLTGDFNEPSCLDWTEAAVKAGACPIKVDWPTTRAVVEAGMVDSYRKLHADEVKQRGVTWTPTTREDDPKDRHDRIDFVFVAGKGVELNKSEVVGEKAEKADVVVTAWPSDHRAVVAEVVVR